MTPGVVRPDDFGVDISTLRDTTLRPFCMNSTVISHSRFQGTTGPWEKTIVKQGIKDRDTKHYTLRRDYWKLCGNLS